MADAPSFTHLVPGFDFLQTLVKNAGAAMPNMGQWVAPTLDPEALEKRIGELKTVQFWLEQNARLLAATIQALEVQRMTLATLKSMNVQMGDLRDAMTIRMPGAAAAPDTPDAPEAADAPTAAPSAPTAAEPAPEPAGIVDPMQWWNALTEQFTDLASAAMKDNPLGAAAQKSLDAASQTVKSAMAQAAEIARPAPGPAAAPQRSAGSRAAAPKATAKKAGAKKSAAARKRPTAR